MFLIMGSYPRERILPYSYNKLRVHSCGKYNKIEIIMRYYVFSIFFIPLIKFSKKYYIKFNCCNEIYELDSDIGKSIEKGENIDIDIDKFSYQDKVYSDYKLVKTCPNCNRAVDEDFIYCPYCKSKL